jgi:hypothetical protein
VGAGQQLLELGLDALLAAGRAFGEEEATIIGEVAARLSSDAVGHKMA